MDELDGLSVGVNVKSPGKGLFSLIRSLGYDPIANNIVQVSQSSTYFDRKDASCLISWSDSTGWASNGEFGGYFELYFPSFYMLN